MFLHKAIKPAQLFVNRILALLQEMGDAIVVAIDEGFHRDLQWFIACAQAVNGSVTIFKCVQTWLNIFVDASLSGLGGYSTLLFTSGRWSPNLAGASPIGRPSMVLLLSRFFLCFSIISVSLSGATPAWLFPFFSRAVVRTRFYTLLHITYAFFFLH
jgi:hypothetical protein